MRIRIKSAELDGGLGPVVSFSSPYGVARAAWRGSAPEVGSVHEVELELPGSLVWGAEIVGTDLPDLIFEEGGVSHLVGSLDSIDENGVAAVRLGDSSFLVETSHIPHSLPHRVLIRASQIVLFEVEL